MVGEVIDTVRCATDSGKSYALYLPKAYACLAVGRPLAAAITLQRMLYAMDGLADMAAEEQRLAALLAEKATRKQARSRRQTLKNEAGLQKAYSEQFMIDFRYPDGSASTVFWKEQGRLLLPEKCRSAKTGKRP